MQAQLTPPNAKPESETQPVKSNTLEPPPVVKVDQVGGAGANLKTSSKPSNVDSRPETKTQATNTSSEVEPDQTHAVEMELDVDPVPEPTEAPEFLTEDVGTAVAAVPPPLITDDTGDDQVHETIAHEIMVKVLTEIKRTPTEAPQTVVTVKPPKPLPLEIPLGLVEPNPHPAAANDTQEMSVESGDEDEKPRRSARIQALHDPEDTMTQ